MATTIKLKNGSGAPLAGDLVQGEPALDLTNKRLYTENASGTIIEVGTNPTSLTTGTFTSTGIDDNATSTAITIDSSENVNIGAVGTTTLTTLTGPFNGDVVKMDGSSGVSDRHLIFSNSSNSQQWDIDAEGGASSLGVLSFSTNSTERMRINSSGNVGIGTNTTAERLRIQSGDVYQISFRNNAASGLGAFGLDSSNNLVIYGNTAERMRIDSSGNVGIGTSSIGDVLDIGIDATSAQHGIGISNQAGITLANFTVNRVTGENQIGATRTSFFPTFYSNGAEAMRIDLNGYVGIGTTSPSAKLHIEGNGAVPFRWGDTSALANLTYTGTTPLIQTNGGALGFWISATEAMRIDASGNVGIGNNSPTYALDITDSTECWVRVNSDATTDCGLRFAHGGTNHFVIGHEGDTDGLQFFDNIAGSERMRIDSSGNLLVGTTSGTNRLKVVHSTSNTAVGSFIHSSTTPSECYGIDIDFNQANPNNTTNFFVRGQDASAVEFHIWSDGSFVQASDRRLKSNIVDAGTALETVNAIQVREFDKGEIHHSHGFIAQELAEVYPEVTVPPLEEDGDKGTWGVNYPRMVPMLVKAIQEQQTMIEELKAEVAALKGA